MYYGKAPESSLEGGNLVRIRPATGSGGGGQVAIFMQGYLEGRSSRVSGMEATVALVDSSLLKGQDRLCWFKTTGGNLPGTLLVVTQAHKGSFAGDRDWWCKVNVRRMCRQWGWSSTRGTVAWVRLLTRFLEDDGVADGEDEDQPMARAPSKLGAALVLREKPPGTKVPGNNPARDLSARQKSPQNFRTLLKFSPKLAMTFKRVKSNDGAIYLFTSVTNRDNLVTALQSRSSELGCEHKLSDGTIHLHTTRNGCPHPHMMSKGVLEAVRRLQPPRSPHHVMSFFSGRNVQSSRNRPREPHASVVLSTGWHCRTSGYLPGNTTAAPAHMAKSLRTMYNEIVLLGD
ncbi:hypothetical protein BV25DRAFT_1839226 [Artomyces pyxidatus]|uniref:Uncharacterized protein n=1 Tax=Artomyces pyxidatus TaxID=48021 RepID=A0ACB8SY98_9AGAM|nr:hypothetical protein BV25DRAFT_1839226 [Artomyces pyxidatus]